MKKTLYIIALLAMCVCTNAQEIANSKSETLTKGSVDLYWQHNVKGDTEGNSNQVNIRFAFCNYVFAEMGFDYKANISFVGGLRYRLYTSDKSLWAEAATGIGGYYGSIDSHSCKVGIMLEPRVGCNLSIGKKGKLGFFLGYRYDAIEFEFNKKDSGYGNVVAGVSLPF